MGASSKEVSEVLRRVRQRREDMGLSQAQVAEAIGVNPSYVGLMERAERVPSLDVLLQLATAVGTTLPDLFAPTAQSKADDVPEIALIRTVLAKWTPEQRKAAVRVVREMDSLRGARGTRKGRA